MGTILIVVLFFVAAIAVRLWLNQRDVAKALLPELLLAREQNRKYAEDVQAKDAQIQSLKTSLLLAEKRAPKATANIIQAKNWRQVLAMNERERADTELKEEEKHENTASR